jgi:3-hydroxyisobutyrate dehydrogenase-like beta-hydroxyacid dehydrogenase
MDRQPVGLIGVGLLGTALAERFLGAGHPVVGFDARPERRQALEGLGGQAQASASAVVALCDRTVLCLPDSAVVEAVLAEVAGRLAPGKVLLDTTTGDPERTARLGEGLAGRGIAYVDACVLGSSAQARAGEAVVLAGGEGKVIEGNADLFQTFACRRFHAGGWGAGARMKLVVNLVLGLNRAVLAEGLAFARAGGLDPEKTLEVLRSGAAYSRVMDAKGEKMLRRDFAPQARLAQHLKDVRLILDQAARAGARVPLSELHRALLERVVELGGGDEDNSAVLRAYD